jgi:hypothetical protein
MHRFAFHAVADSERAQKFIMCARKPSSFSRDKERLFMPPVPDILSSMISIMFRHERKCFCILFGYFWLPAYGSMHYALRAWNPPLSG